MVYVLYIFNLYIYHEIGLVVSEESIKWTIKISSPFFLFLGQRTFFKMLFSESPVRVPGVIKIRPEADLGLS